MKNSRITVATLMSLLLLTSVANIPATVTASYDLSNVAHYSKVKQEFALTAQQEAMLKKTASSQLKILVNHMTLQILQTSMTTTTTFHHRAVLRVFIIQKFTVRICRCLSPLIQYCTSSTWFSTVP